MLNVRSQIDLRLRSRFTINVMAKKSLIAKANANRSLRCGPTRDVNDVADHELICASLTCVASVFASWRYRDRFLASLSRAGKDIVDCDCRFQNQIGNRKSAIETGVNK